MVESHFPAVFPASFLVTLTPSHSYPLEVTFSLLPFSLLLLLTRNRALSDPLRVSLVSSPPPPPMPVLHMNSRPTWGALLLHHPHPWSKDRSLMVPMMRSSASITSLASHHTKNHTYMFTAFRTASFFVSTRLWARPTQTVPLRIQ